MLNWLPAEYRDRTHPLWMILRGLTAGILLCIWIFLDHEHAKDAKDISGIAGGTLGYNLVKEAIQGMFKES